MAERTAVALGTYTPLKGVGVVAQISLGVSTVLNIIGSLLTVAGDQLTAGDLKNLGALFSIIGNVAIILALPVAMTAVAFLIVWLRRAIRNLPALNVHSAKAKEWKAFSFIVPIVNLFMPMLVIQEVWKASDPSYLEDHAWSAAPSSPFILGYWVSIVIQILLFVASWITDNESLSMALLGFATLTGIILIQIVGQLAARQEAKRMLLLPSQSAQVD